MFGVMRRVFTFLNLMKIILNFAVTFEDEYNERFIATRIVDTVKDMIGSDIWTGMSAQSYYQYIGLL